MEINMPDEQLNIFRTKTRILYKHTDQMKVVYYGNYPEFYEIGRVELMRERGFPYAELEAMGIQMPIIEMHSKYIGSALYDELIEIETSVKERDKGVRIRFDYTIYNEAGKIQLIRKNGQLLKEEYVADGIYIEAYVPKEIYEKM